MKSIGPYVVSAVPAPAVLRGAPGGNAGGGSGAGPEPQARPPAPAGARRPNTPSAGAPAAVGESATGNALPLHGVDRLTGMPVLLHRLNEFVVPANMPESPYLLPVYEVDVWDGQPYAITELPPSAIPATHPGSAALGALRALSVLHAAGQVHGNVNAAQLWQVGREVRLAGAGLPRPQGGTPAADLAALGQALDSLGARPVVLDHLETLNTQQALEALEDALHGQQSPERPVVAAAAVALPPQVEPAPPSPGTPHPPAGRPAAPPPEDAAPEPTPRKPNFLASIRRRGKGKGSAPAVQPGSGLEAGPTATAEAEPVAEAGPAAAANPVAEAGLTRTSGPVPDRLLPVPAPAAQEPAAQDPRVRQRAAAAPVPEESKAPAESEPAPVALPSPSETAGPDASAQPATLEPAILQPAILQPATIQATARQTAEVTPPPPPAGAETPPPPAAVLPIPEAVEPQPAPEVAPAEPTVAEPVSYRSAADIIVIGAATGPEDAAAPAEVRGAAAEAQAVPVRLIPAPIRIGFDETPPQLADWTPPGPEKRSLPARSGPVQSNSIQSGPVDSNTAQHHTGQRPGEADPSGSAARFTPAGSTAAGDGQTDSEPPGRVSSVRNQPLRIGWEEDHSWRVVKSGPERRRVQVPALRGPLPRPLLMALAALLVVGGLAYWWRGQGAAPAAGCCTQRFTVSGSRQPVQVTLEQAPPGSPLAAGALIGTVPGTLKFPDVPGSYTLKFTARGHGSLDGVVTVPSDQPFDIVLK